MASTSSLGTLTLDLVANVGGYTGPLDQAERLTKKAMKAMGMAVDEFGNYTDKSMKKAIESVKQLDGQFDRLAENMQREIALYGETTRSMQLRYDLERGALKNLSATQKQSLTEMAARLDAMDSANAAFRSGNDASAGSMRNLRGQAQNLGWQMQDVAVQMQMGTDKMVIFSQQGSQIASGFGPTGAIVGALIAVGGAIAGVLLKNLMMANEAMKEMADSAESLAGELQDLSRVQQDIVRAALGYSIRDQKTAYDEVTESIDAQIRKLEQLQAQQGQMREIGVSVSMGTGGLSAGSTALGVVDNTDALAEATEKLVALELRRVEVAREMAKLKDPSGSMETIKNLAKELELIGLTGKALYEKEAAQKGYLEGAAIEYTSLKMLIDLRNEEVEQAEKLAKAQKDAKDKDDKDEEKRVENINKFIAGMEREAAMYGVTSKAAQVEYDILNGILEVQGGIAGAEAQRAIAAAKRLDQTAIDAKMAENVEKTITALQDEVKALEMGATAWLEYQMQLNNAEPAQIAEAVRLQQRAQALRGASKGLDDLMGKSGLFGGQMEEVARGIDSVYTAMWERVSAKGADVFLDLMNGTDNMFDGIVDAFKQMLAELANEALIQPIMLQVGQNMGIGGTTAGGAGGQQGGGGAGSMMGAMGAGGVYAIAAVAVVAAVNSWNKEQDEKFLKMTAEYRQGVQSTGTLLGMANAKSESIGHLLEDMSGQYDDVLSVNYGMYRALLDIRTGIAGVASGFARSIGMNARELVGGTATGTSAIFSHSSFSPVRKTADLFSNLADSIGEKGAAFGLDFMAAIGDKITKELFKKKITLTDSGIQFLGTALQDILAGGMIDAVGYIDITSEKKVFGVSLGKKLKTETSELDDLMISQITGVFEGAGEALRIAADVFGIDFEARLNELLIDPQKLSLKDLEGDALAKEIEAFFSSTLDNWAGVLLDGTAVLRDFQAVGEGAFETMLRLASETNQLGQMLGFIGQEFGSTGLDAIYLTQQLADLSGGFDVLNTNLGSYYDKFFDDQEKLANLTKQLGDASAGLLETLPKTHAEFRAIIEALDLTTTAGAEAFAELIALAPAIDAYITALERQNDATDEASQAAKSLADFMRDFNDRVSTAYFDDFAMGIFNLDRALEEALATAKELGASEEDLATIRRASAFDMWELQQTQTDAMLARLRESVDAEMRTEADSYSEAVDRLQEEFDARVASLDSWLDTQLSHYARRSKILGESIKDLSSLSGALESALDALRQQSEPLRQQRWFGAVSDIAGMAGSVSAGGALPDAERIKALTQNLGGGQDFFSTFEDYAYASGRALNDVALLKGVTDTQLSVEEKMLASIERSEQNARDNHERMMKRLEDDRNAQQAELDARHQDTMDRLEAAYQTALEQVNAIRGVDTTVATVEQAVVAMKEAIQAELGALRAADQAKYEEMVNALEVIAASTKQTLDIERRRDLEAEEAA